jgi:nitrate/TMAO reductase-like tetraheme cytochrome c subunit
VNLREQFSPIVHLSNNWVSLLGVIAVTTGAVCWFFALPVTLAGAPTHPYVGILVFMILPGIFFGGLVLIPLGIVLRQREERAAGTASRRFPPVNWKNTDFRRIVYFVVSATVVNLVIGGEATYSAVNYMDSVTFCGLTCHNIMQPEYTAYRDSPHARVECVACHIGPGASWFVRSKLSGTGQVFAAVLHTYPRPVPTPVHNLRPARETCEQCHWPAKFTSDRLRVIPSYAEDEQNTLTKTVLLMKVGGGSGAGIHGVHVGRGVRIRYAYSDESRQTIPWVEYRDAAGKATVYATPGTKPPDSSGLPVREMDCIDCHNRPSHDFLLPGRALDNALAAGEIATTLPYIKKQGLEILKANYASRDAAAEQIPREVNAFYAKNYANVAAARAADVQKAGQALVAIYKRNVFPDMNVKWGTYVNNLGHNDFPGCFRCHDGNHTSASGKAVSQDCDACHNLLADDEASPKILSELGLSPAPK